MTLVFSSYSTNVTVTGLLFDHSGCIQYFELIKLHTCEKNVFVFFFVTERITVGSLLYHDFLVDQDIVYHIFSVMSIENE